MKTKGQFLRVRCECKNEQVIFGKAATEVKCLVCNEVLATPTGGKAKLNTDILEII